MQRRGQNNVLVIVDNGKQICLQRNAQACKNPDRELQEVKCQTQRWKKHGRNDTGINER